MATVSSEVCDAFRAAGVPDEMARSPAEVSIIPQASRSSLEGRAIALEGKVATPTWMTATNTTLTLLVLGRFIFVH